ncbi:MAG TPA: hypothetical protein VLJ39_22025, partial [Tepidisphaeraceae bacterium]|nr:hypothetical protein [Tepidisphaeraceae bacterium]
MLIVIAGIALLVGAGLGSAFVYLMCDRTSRASRGQLETGLALAEQRAADAARQLAAERQQTESLRAQIAQTQQEAAALAAQLRSAEQNLVEQRRLLDDAQSKLRDAFANVSAEALAKNNEAFLQLAKQRFAALSTEAAGALDQRKAQIETLLAPMQELLNQYQSRLGEIEKSRVESYSMLREQLGSLA